MSEKLTEEHPYHPRCVIIDDLPAVFPDPLTQAEVEAPLSERAKIKCPVSFKPDSRYDGVANSRMIFEYFHCNRDKQSFIWVLSCDRERYDLWKDRIVDYFLWGQELTPEQREQESAKRIVFIDLGGTPTGSGVAPRPAVRRGP